MTIRAGTPMRLAFIATAAALAAGLACAAHADIIKIGELNSYKVVPAFLMPYRNGWNLALDEINAAGGINGNKLEVISRDDNGNPGDTVRVAQELVAREQVKLLFGGYLSNTGLALADYAKQRRIFFLAAGHSPTRSSGRTATSHVPSAAVDLHAGRDARARSREAQEEALGARVSELRVRPIRGGHLQASAEGGAA